MSRAPAPRRRGQEASDWRRMLIARRRVPTVAPALGRLVAERLFDASDIALDLPRQRAVKGVTPCSLATGVEERVFVAPYRAEPRARLRSRLGEDDPAAHVDPRWKVAAEGLNFALITRSETVLHGRLDTGAVMVAPYDHHAAVTIVASGHPCRGPMAFDLGTVFGSLFLNLLAQDGLGAGAELYRAFVVDQLERLSASFADRFSQRWRGRGDGSVFPRRLFEDEGDADAAEIALTHMLERIEADALAFAGAEIAQSILEPAPEEDLHAIADPDARARVERRALAFARHLMIDRPPTVAAALARLELLLAPVH